MLSTADVRKAIDEKGLKLSWVAGKIGVSPDHLGKWLNGKGTLGKPAQILLGVILELDEAG